MKQRSVYYIVNVFFWLITILAIILINPFSGLVISWDNVFILIISFVFIHVFKCLRQYLLLIESGIHITEFIELYIKATLCSIVLPYKAGEIYKMYLYGNETNDYMKGLIAVIVDKLFDAILLLAIFIPYSISSNTPSSAVTWLLLVFVIIFIVVYFSFKQTYYYLNKHFMLHSSSKRTVYVLSILEKCNGVYKNVLAMLRGRVLLLMFFTLIAWGVEYIFITALNTGSFIPYINAVFFGTQNSILKNYIFVGVVSFLFGLLVINVRKMGRK